MNDMSHTASLDSSADVNGTDVFGTSGEKVGQIDHLMIDKTSGQITYAVMSFGGLLGLGEEHHPIPWKKLSYDTSKDGFITDITKEQLQGAPERTENWYQDREYEKRVFNHYAVPYYWM